jgi:ABC-type oligopeptide transport system ATPase subunit
LPSSSSPTTSPSANYISERTVILRRGAVVEAGATDKVFSNPQHPYTKMLLAAVPHLHRKWQPTPTDVRDIGIGSDGPAATLVQVEDDHVAAIDDAPS